MGEVQCNIGKSIKNMITVEKKDTSGPNNKHNVE